MIPSPSAGAGRQPGRPPTAARERALEPASIDELADALARCGSEKRSVELGGHFSKQWMGGAIQPAEVVISTAKLASIVQYEPRDLTISVEAGLPFCALEDLLVQNNQMLPLDPPGYSGATTVGGALAANCSGPRRRLYGSGRDMVIGMTFVTLEGKPVRSGGMVVKNVAGLDMAKLLIGSFGTLAAIASVNFKLCPRPPLEKTFLLSFVSLDAALKARDAILRSVLQPAAIDLANPAAAARLGVSVPAGYLLAIECGGIEAVMARYERELKTIARDAAAAEFAALEPDTEGTASGLDSTGASPGPARALWQAIRDFPSLAAPDVPASDTGGRNVNGPTAAPGGNPALGQTGARTPDSRAAVLRPSSALGQTSGCIPDSPAAGLRTSSVPGQAGSRTPGTAAILRLSGTLAQLGESFAVAGEAPALARAGSGVAYLYCYDSPAEMAARARAAGFHTVVESSSPENKSTLELWADPGPELEVMSRIKQALDPHRLLNHGRLYNRL